MLIVLGGLFIVGCDNIGNENNNNSGNNGGSSGDLVLDGYEYTYSNPDFTTPKHTAISQFTYNDFFNVGNTVSIDVKVSDTELRLLQADYETHMKTEIYRRADLVTITIRNNNEDFKWTFENVGIRQKGNTSRNDIYDDGDPNNLKLNHYKLSFDETFTNTEMYSNDYIKKYGNEKYATREFLGLSGFDIKWNKNYDMSHVKEIYSQMMYNAFGVIAQKAGLAIFKLNDFNYGLVTTYQKASKSLIKESLKTGTIVNMNSWDLEKSGSFGIPNENYGDLYKASYGAGDGGCWDGADLSNDSIKGKRVGVSNISGSYIPAYDRKTATHIGYDDAPFKNMVNVINKKKYEDIAKVVDLEYLAIEKAVAYYVGNPDDMRYNFNNYMIYIRRIDGKAIFIPIDQDRCFGITKDWNVMNGLMYVGIFDEECSNNQIQRNNLLLSTILNTSTDCSKLYYNWVIKISESDWVKNETFNSLYNIARASYPYEEFSLYDYNYSFNEYITNKLSVVASYGK